ncbi:hypothetical protein AcW2_005869 [Taiwanofungus camphoratus]|nr:hypothetical protein AcW2_005841 [Antrodia cinnamomea]KAI0925190.1 hypothetical protein AcW2_005869 [Antrodia cinnamomea]
MSRSSEQEEAYYEQDRPSYFEDSHQRSAYLVSLAFVSDGTTSDAASATLANTPTSSGRKRKEPETEREAVDHPRKRARTTSPIDCLVLRDNEVQAANCMINLLSHGICSYATGCTIKNTTVTLWYGDRMGIIQSEAFDFIQQPDLLLLYLAAMDSADHARVMKKYEPLQQVNSVDEFKKVLIDVVNGKSHIFGRWMAHG